MEISSNDERRYRLISLSNQLDILLVHDSETEKSSAAVDVKGLYKSNIIVIYVNI